MQKFNQAVIKRIEKIANKVYRNNEYGVYMLINDLEEFFEMNGNDNVDRMTTDEFEQYINEICSENGRM